MKNAADNPVQSAENTGGKYCRKWPSIQQKTPPLIHIYLAENIGGKYRI
jgi:hypothetical protein